MAIILVGGGDLAARLIRSIEDRGGDVALVTLHERDAEEFALAFPRSVVFNGDARDPDVLAQAHAGRADALIAATDDDATNLSTCLLAREVFHIPLVTGLARHPQNVRIFEAAGIPCISCSEIVAAGVMTTLTEHPAMAVR